MPEIALELPALLSLAAAFVLIGLRYGYSYSLGALLRTLALALNVSVLRTHPFGFLAGALLRLDNEINHALGAGIIALQKDAAQWFAWGAQVQQAIGEAIQDVAESTAARFHSLSKATVPLLVGATLGPVWLAIKALQAAVKAHVTTLPATVTKITHLTKSYPVTVQRVTGLPRLVKAAVAAALAGTAGAVTLPRFGQIEADIAALKARLARASGVVTAASAVGVVAYALSKLGLGSQQCSNNKRLAKHLCGMDANRLESLLLDTLLIASSLSLVEFARELVPITEAAVVPIRRFWRVS